MYDPPRIEVTASGYRRSPLLNTCKEVRADALKLFYSINSFNVQALQFDYSAMAKFANGLVAICTRSQLGGISFEVRNQLDAQRKENHAARHRAIYRAVAHIIKHRHDNIFHGLTEFRACLDSHEVTRRIVYLRRPLSSVQTPAATTETHHETAINWSIVETECAGNDA
ncbi:unnamed protein product [Zymoseptoria tritici ST99CH_3D7]|uniref:Uncharacterized protein n=1 Tax=Zymoseptoria tritici (strain ST99CH_3D7) TaxID=1276538 RepID=A0A1X7SAH0_ZYMT9|nr:unnamed protein product [Zymoseptoria tritici ST99CH_3D7]